MYTWMILISHNQAERDLKCPPLHDQALYKVARMQSRREPPDDHIHRFIGVARRHPGIAVVGAIRSNVKKPMVLRLKAPGYLFVQSHVSQVCLAQ